MDTFQKQPPFISSPANPRLKEIVRLRHRSHRDEAGVMIVEGFRELRRALDGGVKPTQVFFCPELYADAAAPALAEECRQAGAQLIQCSRAAFEKIAYGDRLEGLLAVAPQMRLRLEDIRLKPDAIVVVAEAVEKPGNLGAILRSADATGVSAVIACDRGTDAYNPNVIRASTGMIFAVPVVEAGTSEVLAWLDRNEFRIIAATPRAPTVYTDADMRGNVAIVVGTEHEGLSRAWMERADLAVRIPMLGKADSLNVAAATTLLLYEAIRQRGLGR